MNKLIMKGEHVDNSNCKDINTIYVVDYLHFNPLLNVFLNYKNNEDMYNSILKLNWPEVLSDLEISKLVETLIKGATDNNIELNLIILMLKLIVAQYEYSLYKFRIQGENIYNHFKNLGHDNDILKEMVEIQEPSIEFNWISNKQLIKFRKTDVIDSYML